MSATARFRYTLVAGATAVVIGSGFTVVGLNKHAAAQTQVPRAADAPLVADSPAGSPTPAESITPAETPPVSVSPSPSATKKSPAARRTTKAATKSPEPTVSVADTDSSIIGQVLAHINAARTAAGLSALTLDTQLSKASALHNQLMINGCGLQHQCPGESGIGNRFTAQGVKWTSAGENIGYGSSGSSDAAIAGAANGLTDSMLAEKAPNDGHRKNLLNAGFKRIGLSVLRDSKGLTWMTQDFVN